MSDRITTISLPGTGGWMEYGRRTPEEMIAACRSHARQELAEAQAVLAAGDEDFRITTAVGVHVQRNREVLQEGKR